MFSTLLLTFASPAFAQGNLTVTPTRSVSTTAGTGVLGDSGDGGAATSATLASPSGVAYDAAGDIFFADAKNHAVREVSVVGQISTIAGTGVEGYGGDNGPATSAQLDTPTGVAVDAGGDVYIADSHNQRIRMVSAGGTIVTIAGTGVAGFSGDGAAATAAQLALPSAVAVDASGNVYIADTDNQRIRKVLVVAGAGTTISTVAGDGEQTFLGDGAAATAAVLDSPTGVAVDTIGNLYIADRHNQRVRMVTTAGAISTLAGSGAVSFSGSFSGDGTISAAASTLAKPSGVGVDAAGNVFIADTGNQRIREVTAGGGAMATVAGSGQQGFGGDGATPVSLNLNMPKSAAVSVAGTFAIADKLNELVRSDTLPTLTFASTGVGIASAGQSVTFANTGSASLSVAGIVYTGAFATTTGGSCSAPPVTLAAGASCTVNVAFLPAGTGAATGMAVFSGPGVVPQTVLLAGIGTKAASATALTGSAAVLFTGQPVTLSATVAPSGAGAPSGTISFYDGTTLLGPAMALSNGAAALSTSALPVGNNVITAVYSGDSNFSASTSNAVGELVEGFSFALSSTGGSGNQTVTPGHAGVFNFNIAPVNGPFNFPIVLSATGLPSGATITFSPATITLGSAATTFTMTAVIPATAQLLRHELWHGSETMAFALLLTPFGGRLRRAGFTMRLVFTGCFILLGLITMVGLTGCGGDSGFFGQPQKTYTITVVGTAASGNATLQHSTTVTVTVE